MALSRIYQPDRTSTIFYQEAIQYQYSLTLTTSRISAPNKPFEVLYCQIYKPILKNYLVHREML